MRLKAGLAVAGTAVVAFLLIAGAAGVFTDGTSASGGSSSGAASGVADGPAGTAAARTVAPDNASTDELGRAGTVTTRAVVRTATLAVTVADPSAAADRAATIATGVGGRVDQDIRQDAVHLVLRVPADRLDATLAQVAALGDATSRQVQGDDVTAQTADLGAWVQALQTSVDRLTTLVGTSGSLADLLTVETQLTQRQADLESLQAQHRALADQVALATVTVDLTRTAGVVAAASGPSGFGGAVAGGWHGFTVVVRYLLAGLGYALPYLLLAAAVLGVAVVVRRRRGHASPAPAPATAPASGDLSL